MATWDDVEAIGTSLPETVVGEWYKQPALVVAGKGLVHLGEGDAPLAVPTPEKDDLIAARPDVFWSTPHHDGTPWVLCRLAALDVDELRELLRDAWRLKAPAKLRKANPDV